MRVVLAEDNLLVREGLVTLLDRVDDMELCGIASNRSELDAVVAATAPDVVVTDIRMPPGHSDEGVRFAVEAHAAHPGLGVVVLSQFAEPDFVLSVFERGTRRRGYVLKERVADANHLITAIRTVARGGSFIDDEIIDVLMRARSGASRDVLAGLTAREVEVLAEIAMGKTNASIAESLAVSGHAVEKHCGSIFAKLGLSDDASINRRVSAALLYVASAQALEQA